MLFASIADTKQRRSAAGKGQGRGTLGCAAPVIALLVVVVPVVVADKLATDSVLCRHK